MNDSKPQTTADLDLVKELHRLQSDLSGACSCCNGDERWTVLTQAADAIERLEIGLAEMAQELLRKPISPKSAHDGLTCEEIEASYAILAKENERLHERIAKIRTFTIYRAPLNDGDYILWFDAERILHGPKGKGE